MNRPSIATPGEFGTNHVTAGKMLTVCPGGTDIRGPEASLSVVGLNCHIEYSTLAGVDLSLVNFHPADTVWPGDLIKAWENGWGWPTTLSIALPLSGLYTNPSIEAGGCRRYGYKNEALQPAGRADQQNS